MKTYRRPLVETVGSAAAPSGTSVAPRNRTSVVHVSDAISSAVSDAASLGSSEFTGSGLTTRSTRSAVAPPPPAAAVASATVALATRRSPVRGDTAQTLTGCIARVSSDHKRTNLLPGQ